MTKITLRSIGAAAATAIAVFATAPAMASEDAGGGHGVAIARQAWPYAGFKGQYDTAALQRGWAVYQDVCSNCHGLSRLAWRNLVQPGGPEFPEESVKALAEKWPNKITDGPDDNGKMFERPAKLSDPIRGPYKNEKEARSAQNGALPPDLSNITKARNVSYLGTWYAHPLHMLKDIFSGYQEGGSDYLYALMTSYADPPANFKVADGMNYNTAFPGHQIAMVPPLGSGKDTNAEQARDVVQFLAWAADPSLNQRKRMGWIVMLYLAVTTLLLLIAKKRIWANVKH